MNRSFLAILSGAILVSAQAYGGAFDCRIAYTPTEQAICSNSELQSLDRELRLISSRAVEQNLSTTADILSMRNQLVRRCRNSEQLADCLINEEKEEIINLARQLGEIAEIPASTKGETLTERWGLLIENAEAELVTAEQRIQYDGDAEPMIGAAVRLLNLYRSAFARSPADSQLAHRIRELEAKLIRGFTHGETGTQRR
ncbi:hypothetical protein AB833_02770 [Chromatiales bacterium (ex Bugula neritina AB1)]|nr:hypothetical protein AB833_02770 [Chromatiales bacterium (ex Bugula neritina AB1)]